MLAEEELVAIDLTSEGWQAYRPPYLSSLHASAITCASHVSNVPEALWNKISAAGELQFANTSSRVGDYTQQFLGDSPSGFQAEFKKIIMKKDWSPSFHCFWQAFEYMNIWYHNILINAKESLMYLSMYKESIKTAS